LTAADSMTSLGSLYGQSTTASVQIPKQATSIVGIIATVSTDSATNGATTFAMQLSGDGLSQGQETIPFSLDVAIPVVGSNQVSIAMAMDTDVGTASCAVTLVFA
jgi:hypothetical protein